MLPSAESVEFRESSFFARNANLSLPSPMEVRNQAMNSSIYRPNRPRPVRFPELGLVVKFRTEITSAEGQCLWAIRLLLPSVPVPEAYGWCHDGNQVFIYMQLVQAETLERRWPELSDSDKDGVCLHLKGFIRCLGRFQQPPEDKFIGNDSL